MFNLKHELVKVNKIIENCNLVINQINLQTSSAKFYQDENKLLSENTYLFINEFEEVELLKGEFDDNIAKLDIIDNINNSQKYELNIIKDIEDIEDIDEINLSSNSKSEMINI